MKKLFGLALALGICTLLGPAQTSQASPTCTDYCRADWRRCYSDCQTYPYPNCDFDCQKKLYWCSQECQNGN